MQCPLDEIQEGNTGTGTAFLLAEEFVETINFMVLLGDNVVCENVSSFVQNFKDILLTCKSKFLLAKVDNPQNYGVETIENNKIVKIEEKPKNPQLNFVNTELRMFTAEVFNLRELKLSPRGEYEITDVLDLYAQQGQLSYSLLTSEWTDAFIYSLNKKCLFA